MPIGLYFPRAHHAASGPHWLVIPCLYDSQERACPLPLHQLTSSAIRCSRCTVRMSFARACAEPLACTSRALLPRQPELQGSRTPP